LNEKKSENSKRKGDLRIRERKFAESESGGIFSNVTWRGSQKVAVGRQKFLSINLNSRGAK
jgi:hypothetical protein